MTSLVCRPHHCCWSSGDGVKERRVDGSVETSRGPSCTRGMPASIARQTDVFRIAAAAAAVARESTTDSASVDYGLHFERTQQLQPYETDRPIN